MINLLKLIPVHHDFDVQNHLLSIDENSSLGPIQTDTKPFLTSHFRFIKYETNSLNLKVASLFLPSNVLLLHHFPLYVFLPNKLPILLSSEASHMSRVPNRFSDSPYSSFLLFLTA